MSLRSLCALLFVCLLGCGGAELGDVQQASNSDTVTTAAVAQTSPPEPMELPSSDIPSSPVPEGRKIIFHAAMDVYVEDFSSAARRVDRLAVENGGFVTASQRGGPSGSSRHGRWTIRVPVAQYRPLVDTLTELGELQDHHETSQEVTDEYYDLESRITNKQREEQRLITHLEQTARNLNEILTIEREITRVRGEVERMQGRLKLLADKTSLSTIELTLSEITRFVPAETPTFLTRLSRAWNGSFELLLGLLQGIVIFLTTIFPWAVVLLIFAAIGWGSVRFVLRRTGEV